MDKAVLDFLTKEKLSVISVVLESGQVHSATVHFSHVLEPVLKIYVQTSSATVKASPFLSGQVGQGALVVGFSHIDWLTLQMRGTVRLVTDSEEIQKVSQLHYAKHPDAQKRSGPTTVFLEFTPTWWRYTDFKTSPPTIITS